MSTFLVRRGPGGGGGHGLCEAWSVGRVGESPQDGRPKPTPLPDVFSLRGFRRNLALSAWRGETALVLAHRGLHLLCRGWPRQGRAYGALRFQTSRVRQRCGDASHRRNGHRKGEGWARGEDGGVLGLAALLPGHGKNGNGHHLHMLPRIRIPPSGTGEIHPKGFPPPLGTAHFVARPRSESAAPPWS